MHTAFYLCPKCDTRFELENRTKDQDKAEFFFTEKGIVVIGDYEVCPKCGHGECYYTGRIEDWTQVTYHAL